MDIQRVYEEEWSDAWFDALDKDNIDWWKLSCVPQLTLKIVAQNYDKPWHWLMLARKLKFTIHDLRKYEKLQLFDEVVWNYNLKMEDIVANLDLPWNWEILSRRCDITMEIVLQNMDKPWNIELICQYAKISIQDIKTNPDFPWNWDGLSKNLSVVIIMKNRDLPWNWNIVNYRCCYLEKETYVEQKQLNLLIMTIHDYYTKNADWTNEIMLFERILCDAYVVKYLLDY
jgi:hypothetical protein